MRFGRGNWHWYDFLLLGLAALIVYPDKVLEWLSALTGRALGWGTLLIIEAVAITLLIGAMVWLMPLYPKLTWGQPLLYIGMVALFRVLLWGITRMFGFDD